jgi:murein L,D-transpeptidase YcbB/YkuD
MCVASCGPEKRGGAAGNSIEASDFDVEEFKAAMRATLPSITADSGGKKEVANIQMGLRRAYEASAYSPLWLSEEGEAGRAEKLLADLEELRWDGLSPEAYGLPALKQQAQKLKDADVVSLISFDTACTGAYLRASRDLLLGVVSVRRADSLWFHANDSVWTAPEMLARDGEYPSFDSFRSTIPTYTILRKEHRRLAELSQNNAFISAKASLVDSGASDSLITSVIDAELPAAASTGPDSLQGTKRLLAAYQAHYGLKQTAKADSTTLKYLRRHPDSSARVVRANLERLRWLPRQFSDRYVLVNVPLMELFYREGGRDEFTMRVVVGRPSRQTPTLSAPMANVVFNPPWGVPPTILKNDVLPGIARRGGAYLARKGLTAYDRRGRPVNAGAINARNYTKYNFRQPPGAHNALGEIKFNMPNRWDIYLHDTPHREDFPKRNRALSSGCVRVQKPKEFAEFILAKIEGRQEFDQYRIDSLISTRVTKFENLETELPVHIVYLTAFEDGSGGVRFLEDIYKKDRKLLALVP